MCLPRPTHQHTLPRSCASFTSPAFWLKFGGAKTTEVGLTAVLEILIRSKSFAWISLLKPTIHSKWGRLCLAGP